MVLNFNTPNEEVSTEANKVSFANLDGSVVLEYQPETSKALYDICDFEGRIICTGKIDHPRTAICGDNLDSKQVYVIWILDGDKVIKERFQLSA